MTYELMHFLHDLGALGLAAAFAIEGLALYGLRQSVSAENVRRWLDMRRWLVPLGTTSMAIILVTGFYAMIANWSWQPWLVMSLVGMVAIVILGGTITGVTVSRLEREVRAARGPLTQETRGHVLNSVLVVSLTTRIALAVGITFLMVVKPALPISTLSLVLFSVLGAAVGVSLSPTPRPHTPTVV
jgi:hypothetical protein